MDQAGAGRGVVPDAHDRGDGQDRAAHAAERRLRTAAVQGLRTGDVRPGRGADGARPGRELLGPHVPHGAGRGPLLAVARRRHSAAYRRVHDQPQPRAVRGRGASDQGRRQRRAGHRGRRPGVRRRRADPDLAGLPAPQQPPAWDCFQDVVRRLLLSGRALAPGSTMTVLRLRADGLFWRETQGEVVALDAEASRYFAANPTAAALWKRLSEGATEADLVDTLC